MLAAQCSLWREGPALQSAVGSRFVNQFDAKPLDASLFLTFDTGEVDTFGGNAALIAVGSNKLFCTAAHCAQHDFITNTATGAGAILKQPADVHSTYGYADIYIQRADSHAFANQISTTCPAIGYMRSFYVGEDGRMRYKILRGELYWSQAIAAGTCLHNIPNRDE